MGQSSLDFQAAQNEAANYATTERKHKRWSYLYALGAIVTTLLTLAVAPKLVIPSLLISGAVYGIFRYGGKAIRGVRHWWLKRQVQQDLRNTNINHEPLLGRNMTRQKLVTFANTELRDALKKKMAKIEKYESTACLVDDAPLPYYDQKHKRALIQYRMLERTQEAALNGQEDFITWMADDRQSRRAIKIEILKEIKKHIESEHMDKLSLSLKRTHRSPEGECVLGGAENVQNELFTKIAQLNKGEGTPLYVQENQTMTEKDFMLKTLLPLVLDMDAIISTIQPQDAGQIFTYYRKKVIPIHSYSINAEYLDNRIKILEKAQQNVEVVNDRKSFELV